MVTKQCSKCRSVLPLTRKYWYVKTKSSDGFSAWCKPCKKELDKKRNNRKEVRKANLSASARKKLISKTYMYDVLARSSCVDCGETNILVLEFDHVRGTKHKGVGQLAREGYSLPVIKEEIDKCEVRCSNCHRTKTHKENNTHVYRYLVEKGGIP